MKNELENSLLIYFLKNYLNNKEQILQIKRLNDKRKSNNNHKNKDQS